MRAFEIDAVDGERREAAVAYREFLRVPALSAGLYVLPAGGVDRQRPHAEDEVYYVVSGRATVRVGDEQRAVAPGSVVYVPATVEHRFLDVVEDLRLLVLFAPAESGPDPSPNPVYPGDAT